MLTKENCESALEEYDFRSERPLPYEYSLLRRLINEHFDNPPLKWEELKEGMWVWDNKYEQYIKIRRVRKGRCFVGYYPNFEVNPETDELCENLQGIFFFEENRYFRKQVEE